MPTYLTTAQETRLRRMAGESHKADANRMLTDDDLDDIAGEAAQVQDADGYAPDSASYTITLDLYRAASAAWEAKAGMVAEGYDFAAEGAEFNRSQAYKHYIAQAKRFASMAGNLTMEVGRPAIEDTDSSAFDDWLQGGDEPSP